MAKNTKAQQVTTGTSASYTAQEVKDPHPPYVIERAMIGEVREPSDGTSSPRSIEREENSSDKPTADPQSDALGAESHSKRPEKETASGAPLTATDGLKENTKPSVRRTPPKKAGVRSAEDDDFSDFE